MTKLAAYLPAMEELNPEDFADHDHSTEFTQYAVTASGIELGQAEARCQQQHTQHSWAKQQSIHQGTTELAAMASKGHRGFTSKA